MARQRTASAEVREARGRNLKRERERAGLSLEALGAQVGLSAEQVRKYQIARDFLGAAMCWRFSRALGCSFGALFDPRAEGVAETSAAFTFDHADEGRLGELLARAEERLTGARRALLRDILLDMLEDEESVAA